MVLLVLLIVIEERPRFEPESFGSLLKFNAFDTPIIWYNNIIFQISTQLVNFPPLQLDTRSHLCSKIQDVAFVKSIKCPQGVSFSIKGGNNVRSCWHQKKFTFRAFHALYHIRSSRIPHKITLLWKNTISNFTKMQIMSFWN